MPVIPLSSAKVLLLSSFKAQQGQGLHTTAMVRKTGTCQGKDPKVTRRLQGFVLHPGIKNKHWDMEFWELDKRGEANKPAKKTWRKTLRITFIAVKQLY